VIAAPENMLPAKELQNRGIEENTTKTSLPVIEVDRQQCRTYSAQPKPLQEEGFQ
jgi:hypothetical protein